MSSVPPANDPAGAAQAVVVLCTVPDADTGRDLSRALVGEGLVACVNLVPGLTSIYRWQGKVQEDREELLVIKTTPERVEAVVARIRELHPYDCPEAIALPVVAGSAAYLAWVRESVTAVG